MKISGDRILYEATRSYAELSDEFGLFNGDLRFSKFMDAMQRGLIEKRNWEASSYHFKMVWDSTTHRELYESQPDSPNVGILRFAPDTLLLSSREPISAGLLIWPALLSIRPSIATGLTSEHPVMKIEREDSMIGDHQCAVVTLSLGNEVNLRLWVDPNIGFSVVRAMGYSINRLRNQLDISYEVDEIEGFVPKSWTAMVFSSAEDYPGRQEVFQSAHIEMDHRQLNGAEEPAIVPIKFPTGCLVRDAVSDTFSVVRGPDDLRPATLEEKRIFFGRGEPELLDPTPIASRYNRIVIAGLVATIAMMVFLQVRKRATAKRVSKTALI